MVTDTVPCRYCKQEISPTAKRCPHCGTISPNLQIKSIFGIIILMLAVFFIYTLVIG
jgi:RNA polymerase subunit RPABC4/transcription elongation factor Spt4